MVSRFGTRKKYEHASTQEKGRKRTHKTPSQQRRPSSPTPSRETPPWAKTPTRASGPRPPCSPTRCPGTSPRPALAHPFFLLLLLLLVLVRLPRRRPPAAARTRASRCARPPGTNRPSRCGTRTCWSWSGGRSGLPGPLRASLESRACSARGGAGSGGVGARRGS